MHSSFVGCRLGLLINLFSDEHGSDDGSRWRLGLSVEALALFDVLPIIAFSVVLVTLPLEMV